MFTSPLLKGGSPLGPLCLLGVGAGTREKGGWLGGSAWRGGWSVACRGAGAPTRVPRTFSTPGNEAEVGRGSGCLTWAKRVPWEEVGGEQGPRPQSYLQHALLPSKLPRIFRASVAKSVPWTSWGKLRDALLWGRALFNTRSSQRQAGQWPPRSLYVQEPFSK